MELKIANLQKNQKDHEVLKERIVKKSNFFENSKYAVEQKAKEKQKIYEIEELTRIGGFTNLII